MITTLLSLVTAATLTDTFQIGPLSANQSNPLNNPNPVLELPASKIPHKNTQFIQPLIEAKAALSVDLENGLFLYEKNSDQKLPMASLTKLMTVTIILEENALDETVTIPNIATKIEGSKIWLASGEKIKVESLLKAALIPSANDAALSLALHNSESVEKFVEKMNKKAQKLGMYNTNFRNPTGLDEDNHYSTAYDLSLLGRYIAKNDLVSEIVKTKEVEISSNDGKLKHKLSTTNELLSTYLKVLGLKTGTTDLAGACLISIVENEKGDKILNIILNSPNRFQESKILAEWTFKAYQWN